MFGTFTLGQLFGVTVRVHGLVLALFAGLLLLGGLRGQPVALPLAALVIALLAHELAHALVARRLGLRVYDVVLWPLGGMARMSEVPEQPGIEARIAAAGPLVNLALAGLCLAALGALGMPAWSAAPFGPAGSLQVFLAVNLLLGLGNLVPAFPMDGGRLLRAALVASGRNWLAATELAVRIGRWLAVVGLVLGLVHSFVLAIVALFVLVEGFREVLAVRLRHGAPLFRGAAAFGPFGRTPFGGAPFEAAASDGARPEPTRVEPTASAALPERGFSDADIERLERFRGRLRRPGDGMP